jgi:type IV fimbrial biogenesis protein FimT
MDSDMAKIGIGQRGFSLLELMVVIAILAIVLTFGVPSMTTAIEKRDTIAAAEQVYSELQLARSEAIARSQPLFMNFVNGANWAVGFSDDATCDPADNAPVCDLPDLANNNPITHRFTFNDHPDVSVASTAAQITFQPQRGTATSADVDITSTGDVGYVMTVTISPLGHMSMCSSNADPAKHVSGYDAC